MAVFDPQRQRRRASQGQTGPTRPTRPPRTRKRSLQKCARLEPMTRRIDPWFASDGTCVRYEPSLPAHRMPVFCPAARRAGTDSSAHHARVPIQCTISPAFVPPRQAAPIRATRVYFRLLSATLPACRPNDINSCAANVKDGLPQRDWPRGAGCIAAPHHGLVQQVATPHHRSASISPVHRTGRGSDRQPGTRGPPRQNGSR